MQQFDVPFIRRQKQNTDIWKGHHFKDNSFEEERSSHQYKKQHRRKSCYCQLCGRMSLFQYTYMNVSTCVNFIHNSLIVQQNYEKLQELQQMKNEIQDKQLRDSINLQYSFRNKSFINFKQLFFQEYSKHKQRKSCDCSQCGNQNAFQKNCQNYQINKKQHKYSPNQYRVKKTIKRHQFRKQNTEQFSPIKNGELKYLKKRMIELDLNDYKLLSKFQLRKTQNSKLYHHQQSLNFIEISSRQRIDIQSPLVNKKTLLPYLSIPQNRSPQQKLTKKQTISNLQRNNFKKNNLKSGIF